MKKRTIMNITSSLLPEIVSRHNEFVRTCKAAAMDEEILLMAEEGLEEYLKILDEECCSVKEGLNNILTY